jgi:hypothetical protein
MISIPLLTRLAVAATAAGMLAASHAADVTLRTSTGLITPSTRGQAQTTHFGWDFFEDPATYNPPATALADDTPDITSTTTPAGVKFESLHGNKNRASSGNFYSGFSEATAMVNERVTVVTDGTPGVTGSTTILVQMIAGAGFGGGPGNFASTWLFSPINGVAPVEVLQTRNRNGFGQVWVKWELPGNQSSYQFDIQSVTNAHMSFDKIVIDTWYSADGESHPDRARLAPGANFTLNREPSITVPTTRGSMNTTHFGWDNFEHPNTYTPPGTVLADSTPDIRSAMTPEGARFESLHSNLNRASSGNFYSGFSEATAMVNERVTVVTRGAPGMAGSTTIIVQMIAGSFQGNPSDFASAWQFSEINGVAPAEVLQTRNGANFGHVWARWELPGNQPEYELTITSATNAHMSFDRIEIDTWYDEGGASHPDSMILSEPAAIGHVMEQLSGPVAPSSRGGRGTTYFGWDTWGTPGSATVIDDNTPDIGSDPSGLARFRTTNGEIHQMVGGGNIYFLSGTLAEEVTVPTDGLPGSEGFTTIFLQISSVTGPFGGANFAGPITLSSINGVAPQVVQASGSVSAQLWAKWVVPGNQETYTISITGPPNQAHFSFDQVVVDTKYSRYEGVGDTMRARTVEITTATLAGVVRNEVFSAQLEAEGGTAPLVWSLKAGSALPAGLQLGQTGLLSGTPTVIGDFHVTVVVTEGGGFTAERELALRVLPSLKIVSPATLPTAVTGRAYEFSLQAADGEAPYEWLVLNGQLPEGMALSVEGVIHGTPMAAGDATVEIQVTDADGSSAAREFTLPVSPVLLAPVMNALDLPPTAVGAGFSHRMSAENYPASFQIMGLPRGLRWNARSGEITGRPLEAGAFVVRAQAFNSAGGSGWVSGVLVVRALGAMQQGGFTGWSSRDEVNGGLGSLVSVRTTATGAYTLSVRTGGRTVSARGFLNGGAPQIDAGNVGGGHLVLSIDGDSGELSGSHGGALVRGWRAVWDRNLNPASELAGYYSFGLEVDSSHAGEASLPEGMGFGTFTLAESGVIRLRGRTADGQNIGGNGTLGPNGEMVVYAPQHGNRGSVLGELRLSAGAGGVFTDNEVSSVVLTWSKPGTRGRVHAGGFGPVSLNARGGYLAQGGRGQTVLGLPEVGEITLEFEGGGIGESETVANVSGIEWTERFSAVMPAAGNAAGVRVSVNRATGAMSGSFTLVESAPLARRSARFFGQVVRGLAGGETRAAGYFLLPQLPGAGERANRTPVRSGAVHLTQPVVP